MKRLFVYRFTLVVIAMVAVMACGGGDSSEQVASSEPTAQPPSSSPTASVEDVATPTPEAPVPTATPEPTGATVSSFEADEIGYLLRVSNLTAGQEGLSAEIAIENKGDYGYMELDLASSSALLLTESQAAAWQGDYPRAYQEVDMERLAEDSGGISVPLMVTSSAIPLPARVEAGGEWTGTVFSGEPVGTEVSAVVLVLADMGTERWNDGSIDSTLYFVDKTKPFIGLHGEVTVVPLPPLEPLRLESGDSIAIPKLGIDQPLVLLPVGRDGAMPDPDQSEIAMYDFAEFGLGIAGSPKAGNTILAAFHSNQQGPGPFQQILTLVPGDAINLIYQGQSYDYTVAWKCTIPSSDFAEIVRKDDVETLTVFPGIGGPTQYVIRAELEAGSISGDCPEDATVFTGTDVPPR